MTKPRSLSQLYQSRIDYNNIVHIHETLRQVKQWRGKKYSRFFFFFFFTRMKEVYQGRISNWKLRKVFKWRAKWRQTGMGTHKGLSWCEWAIHKILPCGSSLACWRFVCVRSIVPGDKRQENQGRGHFFPSLSLSLSLSWMPPLKISLLQKKKKKVSLPLSTTLFTYLLFHSVFLLHCLHNSL